MSYQNEKFYFRLFQDNLSVFFTIAAFVFLGLVVKIQFSAQSHFAQINNEEDSKPFTYEMPRPASAFREFNFSDRDVDVEFISKSTEGKPSSNEKAAEKNAKNPSDTDPKTTKANAKTEQNKKEGKDKKKSSLTTNVVDTSRTGGNSSLPGSDSGLGQQTNASPGGTGEFSNIPAQEGYAGAQKNQDDSKNENPKTSASEWRDLIMRKPTHENAAKLTKAYNNGEIDKNSYYGIIAELLKNNWSDCSDLAIYMLSSDGSADAFELMAQESPDLNEEIKNQLKPLIEGYSHPEKLSVLTSVLQSKDSVVLSEALGVIETALQNKTKVTTSSEREARGIASPVASDDLFLLFLPKLKKLSSSSDSSIAKDAQNLADKIQLLQD